MSEEANRVTSGRDGRSSVRSPESDRVFSVGALPVDDDVTIGVSSRPDDGSSIDDFPDAAYDDLVDRADDVLDWSRLERETADGQWPRVGTVVISRDAEAEFTMTVDWDDRYVE